MYKSYFYYLGQTQTETHIFTFLLPCSDSSQRIHVEYKQLEEVWSKE